MKFLLLATLVLSALAQTTYCKPDSELDDGLAPVPVPVLSASHPIIGSVANSVEPAVVVSGPVHPQPVVSQYSPVLPVSDQSGKPISGVVPKFEQYGQPESQSIPAAYKPFGSWGLYIGGNPSDGHYSNFYKSLSSSVEQALVEKPVSAIKPILKAAGPSGSFQSGAEYYPIPYSPSEFSSGSPVMYSSSVYQPSSFGQSFGGASYYSPDLLSYGPEKYSTKGGKGTQQQQEVSFPVKSTKPVAPVKSALSYYYSSPVSGAVQAFGLQHQQQQPQQQVVPQVVAYPVPIGSQIVGSQVGTDGAYYPYGVHAFTKYAVKPTLVSSVDGLSSPVLPAYNQAQLAAVQPGYQYSAHQAPVQQYQHHLPTTQYYAYPAHQLHYSNGAVVPTSHSEAVSYSVPVATRHSVSAQVDKVEEILPAAGSTKS